ncbi:MAG TPA: alkaline phosphatase, partial [Enterococcus sp.]|nr:alkaline phosphatase [Enterococcus sp.]
MKKSTLGMSLLSCLVVGGIVSTTVLASSNKEKAPTETTQEQPKNIIFMIGDGMGVSYTSAYRYFKEGKEKIAPDTAFDRYLVGQQATHPEDPEENVTDSAAAATAMSAGVKTYNNAIAVDNDLSDTPTVLERAKELGKSTGLVATSEITHATPAAFGAHDESR